MVGKKKTLKDMIVMSTEAVLAERKARLQLQMSYFLANPCDENLDGLKDEASEVLEAVDMVDDAKRLCDTCGHEESEHEDLGMDDRLEKCHADNDMCQCDWYSHQDR